MTSDPRQLAALLHAQETMLASGVALGPTLIALVRHLRQLTGGTGAVVELLDERGIVSRAAADGAAAEAGVPLDERTVTARATMQRRLLAWHADAHDGLAAGRDGASAAISAPLLEGDRLIGAVTVIAERPDALDAQDEHTVRVLARFAAHQIVQVQRLEEAERTSRLDPLTGLGNRRALDECLSRELARHIRYERAMSLCVVDLDGFKAVNDQHGHQEGDRVLVQVARRLGEIRGADAAFRLGGDEFAVVLPETAAEAAELVARRLARRISDDMFPFEVTATWGTAQASGPDPAELVAAADARLYERKRDRPSARASGA